MVCRFINWKISARYLKSKPSHWRVTVTNTDNDKRACFDLPPSLELKDKYDLPYVFYYIVEDAICCDIERSNLPDGSLWKRSDTWAIRLRSIYDGDLRDLHNDIVWEILSTNYGH